MNDLHLTENTTNVVIKPSKEVLDLYIPGPCWFCGKKSEHRVRAKTGWDPGPYHYSPHVEYCMEHLSDCIDWMSAVVKDLRVYRKAVKERK